MIETNATIWHHGVLDSCQLIKFYSLASHLLANVLHKLLFSWQTFVLPKTSLHWACLSLLFEKKKKKKKAFIPFPLVICLALQQFEWAAAYCFIIMLQLEMNIL